MAMEVKEVSLKANITKLLAAEFDGCGTVSCFDNQVIIILSGNTCQQNFGIILQRIQRAIDEGCPCRKENLFVLVRDEAGAFQNLIKIWKSN